MKVLGICILVIAFACMSMPGEAVAQLETPQPSPLGKIEQKVGVMTVKVEYSRPSVKGRKIFGDLVPFGQEWRTGANAPTTISFSDKVQVDGKEVPAGTYSLYTVPAEKEWKIVLNKKTDGGTPRDQKEDVVSFSVKPVQSAMMIETFTINIADITTNTANVELAWENTVVKFDLTFDVDAKVMAAIKKSMENPNDGVAGMHYQAASYYFATGKDNKVALGWVNKSIELNKKPYWVWRLKSQLQASLKDYKGAVASAEASKASAKEAGNDQFVKFNEDAIAEWSKMK